MLSMRYGITKLSESGRWLKLKRLNVYSRSPGDYKLQDVNDDGYYTDADKQFLGIRRPTFRLTLRNTSSIKTGALKSKCILTLDISKQTILRNNEAFYDRWTYYNVPYWTT